MQPLDFFESNAQLSMTVMDRLSEVQQVMDTGKTSFQQKRHIMLSQHNVISTEKTHNVSP